jgi:hypothetical protein
MGNSFPLFTKLESLAATLPCASDIPVQSSNAIINEITVFILFVYKQIIMNLESSFDECNRGDVTGI